MITFLFCFVDCIQNINIGWLRTLDKVLLGMLDNAIGTQGHQTVNLAAEICEVLVGMIGTIYLFHLFVMAECAVAVVYS